MNHGAMDDDKQKAEVADIDVEELLRLFVTSALGLTLTAKIATAAELPAEHRGCLANSLGRRRPWSAWRTNEGLVSICGDYEHAQSQRARTHVLKIAWWINPGEHHEGWWRCNPKRPCEWIKGSGAKY